MGLALLRARYLDVGRPPARRLGRRDGSPRGGRDRARHRDLAANRSWGCPWIAPGQRLMSRRHAGAAPANPKGAINSGRGVVRTREMLFADVRGSRAGRRAVAPLGSTCWGHSPESSNATPMDRALKNTWGDALYVVLDRPRRGRRVRARAAGGHGRDRPPRPPAWKTSSPCASGLSPARGRVPPRRSPVLRTPRRSPARMSAAPRASSRSRRPARCS